MKKIRIDEKDVDLLATPYSLVLYTREFGDDKDLVNDSMTLVQGFQNGKINGILLLQVIWCFAKTAKMMENVKIFPAFDDWMMGLQSVDVGNQDNMILVTELINERLFREEKKEEPKSEQQSGE